MLFDTFVKGDFCPYSSINQCYSKNKQKEKGSLPLNIIEKSELMVNTQFETPNNRNPMLTLSNKLISLNSNLTTWIRENTGNLGLKIKENSSAIKLLEDQDSRSGLSFKT